MKPNFTKFVFGLFLPLAAYGQTIVSTDPQNKKVILEEFTAIHCTYCPQGHIVANQIMEDNPGNVFTINYHVGGLAVPGNGEPDFRTPFGNAVVYQTGMGMSGTGIPSGTVNRHNFPGKEMAGHGGITLMDRSNWTAAANETIAQPSYLNVGVEAEIDASSRLMTVNVEIYYTGDSPEATNFLNVALIQNNTTGPQSGGGQGNNYNHMHRLVHLITGQWGEEITTTTEGSLISKTFTYEIPPLYKNVFADIEEFEIVAFVTETTQEIVSGNGAEVMVIPSEHSNDLLLSQNNNISPLCNDDITAKFILLNTGSNAITSTTLNYSVNGGESQSYEWTGNLESNAYEEIEVPINGFEILDNNTIIATISDDENNENNETSFTFDKAGEYRNVLTLTIDTDNHGSDCSWNIKNSAGEIVEEGNGYGNNQIYTIDIVLPEAEDCYEFNLIDSYGDGGTQVTLVDVAGTEVFSASGNYGSGKSTNFSAFGTLNTVDSEYVDYVNIYPNPTKGIVNISSKSLNSDIQIFDTAGRKVYSTKSDKQLTTIDLSAYGKGLFVVKVYDGKKVVTKKVIIK